MRRSTTIYILLLAITVGAYYYLKNRPASEAESTPEAAFTFEPAPEITYLFPAELGEPTGIRVEAQTGEIIELALNADNVWALKQPLEVAAEQTAVATAISQVVTLQIMDRLSGVAPSDVGLDAPTHTLIVTFKDGEQRTVQLGVVTPSEAGYYALVDNEVVIINKLAIDALTGLIANPPYAETLTPSPTLTKTSLPTTETLTPAPEPAATLTATP